jgi:hypothetical protein
LATKLLKFCRFLTWCHYPPEALVRRVGYSFALAILCWSLTSSPAAAGSITFDFNGPALGDGKNSTYIKNYMNGVLSANWGPAFAVTGLAGAASETNNSYTGDNHVVGHKFGPLNKMTSMTLGNSEHARAQGLPGELGTINALAGDGYIFNSAADMFWMEFNFPIQSVSFDYQIFPNGSCANPNDNSPTNNPTGTCSRWPDFKFKAGVPGDMDLYIHSFGQDPSDPDYQGYKNSPIRPNLNYWEKAPQLLTVSGLIVLNQPSTRLEFWDWPERVGIDNLVISTPEPASFLFVGAGALLVGLATRRRRP